jgi:hypothetical protein
VEKKVKDKSGEISLLARILAALLIVPALGACSEKADVGNNGQQRKSIPAEGALVSLTLTGYNYTNRHIDHFSVNSNGGGNLYVSSPTSGGGGSVCCVSYIVGVKKWRILVNWQTDACTYNNRVFSNGRRGYEIYRYFTETEVDVDPSIPNRPNYLEVHFYPDGHLEAMVTEQSSAPRLSLPREREDKTPYRTCPNDERPED